ncbi:hypothetical protein PZ938_03010 [Luteipulveratus sp. YIM 133132]|uniref:hypothetical protein n=1 Tax=Luteipulveratus flavus TaxID=3031728 RepID=UPI0023AFA39F|nr:hypothetical protein [Luteipulveratus sp. YIM 133132]MDE9364562.1 hypothetical protein [Luteipulveratus sp. YIM 133132]
MAQVVRNRAVDTKGGMTLADLQTFIDDCWRVGIAPTAKVRVWISADDTGKADQ